MAICIRRREFIGTLGSAAAAWPLTARAQQPALPVIGFINGGSADASAPFVAAFRRGLNETGFVDGQNVAVEYHWLEGKYDQLPALVGDLVRRRVALIATPASGPAARAAKAATSTIPIVFSVAQDPVQLGLVASLARPGGNATGLNFFSREVAAKRLRLLHDLVPKAVRVAVLLNPANAGSAEANLREVQEAAPAMGLKSKSSTPRRQPRSMRPLPALRASAPMPSSSLATVSSPIAACNLPRSRRATGFRRLDQRVGLSKPGCRRATAPTTRRRFIKSATMPADPQGREASRAAGAAIDQIRVRSEPANGASARHRGAGGRALHRRRGDRMRGCLVAIAHSRFWHRADDPGRSAFMKSFGASGPCRGAFSTAAHARFYCSHVTCEG